MERREGWLGYIALGVGVLALLVALGGRFSGPQIAVTVPVGADVPNITLPSAPFPPGMPTVPAPSDLRGAPDVGPRFEQSIPAIPGRGGFGREQRFERHFQAGPAWGGHSWGFGGPFHFLGGIARLVGVVLLIALLLRFLRRRGGGRWGKRQDAHWQGQWHGYQQQAPQAPQPPQATPPTPPAPPSPPQTGQTIQF